MSRSDDDSQLQLLSVFQFIYAGICGIGSLVPVIHVVIGIVILNEGFSGLDHQGPPPFVGWAMIGFGSMAILLGLVMTFLILRLGFSLQSRGSHTFCLVIAAIECLAVPIGTILGVFTIVVLLRDSVKSQFGIAGYDTDGDNGSHRSRRSHAEHDENDRGEDRPNGSEAR